MKNYSKENSDERCYFRFTIVEQINITHIHFTIESFEHFLEQKARQPKKERNMIIQKWKKLNDNFFKYYSNL